MCTEAIIYTRFSPRKNEGEVNSGKQQEDACREYCKAKGYEVVKVINDEYVSGDEVDRPVLLEAIDKLKRNQVIVVFKLDRLARDVCLSEVLRREIRNKGARVEFVKDDFCNGDNPESNLIRQIFQAFAEYEKKVIAMRTKYALLHQQRAGRLITRPDLAPYGYKLDEHSEPHRESKIPSRLVKDEAEQEVIATMLKLREEGKKYSEICRYLNSQNIKPRQAKEWSRATVRNVCRREILQKHF